MSVQHLSDGIIGRKRCHQRGLAELHSPLPSPLNNCWWDIAAASGVGVSGRAVLPVPKHVVEIWDT